MKNRLSRYFFRARVKIPKRGEEFRAPRKGFDFAKYTFRAAAFFAIAMLLLLSLS